jgi:hypothetical protein
MSRADQLQLAGCEPDIERLVNLTAPERAQVYSLAELDLAQREYLELRVRARIRAEARRRGERAT